MVALAGAVVKSHSTESNAQQHDSTGMAGLPDAAAVHRHAKRVRSIQAILQKFGYDSPPCFVTTPDPFDPNISKRRWESVFAKWRETLRDIPYGRAPGI